MQGDHLPQAVQLPSCAGQAALLHSLVSRLAPLHWRPPCCGGGALQARLREREPRPQLTEQKPHRLQADQAPSTSHSSARQASVSARAGQFSPPCRAGRVTTRCRARLPALQQGEG